MSLENNLKRIADSLELIASHLTSKTTAPAPQQETAAPAPSIQTESKAEVNPTPEMIASQNVAPAPMTPEALNAALVAEFNRLGDRTPIDNALKEMGVTGVTELPAERYQELLTKVQAISNG